MLETKINNRFPCCLLFRKLLDVSHFKRSYRGEISLITSGLLEGYTGRFSGMVHKQKKSQITDIKICFLNQK